MPPAKCEQCGREFGSEHGLKIHVGREHGGRGKAKRGRGKATVGVTCAICARSFKAAMHLARHTVAAHAGLDVSNLNIDQLLSLKTALDARLSDLVRKLRKARVRV